MQENIKKIDPQKLWGTTPDQLNDALSYNKNDVLGFNSNNSHAEIIDGDDFNENVIINGIINAEQNANAGEIVKYNSLTPVSGYGVNEWFINDLKFKYGISPLYDIKRSDSLYKKYGMDNTVIIEPDNDFDVIELKKGCILSNSFMRVIADDEILTKVRFSINEDARLSVVLFENIPDDIWGSYASYVRNIRYIVKNGDFKKGFNEVIISPDDDKNLLLSPSVYIGIFNERDESAYINLVKYNESNDYYTHYDNIFNTDDGMMIDMVLLINSGSAIYAETVKKEFIGLSPKQQIRPKIDVVNSINQLARNKYIYSDSKNVGDIYADGFEKRNFNVRFPNVINLFIGIKVDDTGKSVIPNEIRFKNGSEFVKNNIYGLVSLYRKFIPNDDIQYPDCVINPFGINTYNDIGDEIQLYTIEMWNSMHIIDILQTGKFESYVGINLEVRDELIGEFAEISVSENVNTSNTDGLYFINGENGEILNFIPNVIPNWMAYVSNVIISKNLSWGDIKLFLNDLVYHNDLNNINVKNASVCSLETENVNLGNIIDTSNGNRTVKLYYREDGRLCWTI